MGTVIRTTPGKLPGQLGRLNQSVRRAIARGALRGAHRGRAIIVRETPTDQSQLKQAWKVSPGSGFGATGSKIPVTLVLASLDNLAPHAGIVELGARPHRVSAEGIQSIADWAYRNLEFEAAAGPVQRGTGGRRAFDRKTREQMALDVAHAIAWKIRHEGQEPTYFVKRNLENLEKAVRVEIDKAIEEVSKRGGGG